MAPDVMEQTDAEPNIPIDDGPLEDAPDQSPVHLARCAECAIAVRYVPSASGAGFVLEDAGDLTFGVGANGRPTCPNGHGEMAIADDQIPAQEAITEAARMQEAQQASLPGIIPPFNYQGAYLELEEKALEVDRLHSEYEDAAAEARDAKKRWDKAAELYTKMAVEFRRRRREKVAAGEPVTDVDPSRCTFEQMHPDRECPICDGSACLEVAVAPKNAAEHVQQAEGWLLTVDVEAVGDALYDIELVVNADTIRQWSDWDRAAVKAYAVAVAEKADPLPARPAALGSMHVAGEPAEDGSQACTQCDGVLVAVGDEDRDHYLTGWLVGTDCPGKPKDEHRYTPTRSEKAPGKKKAAKKGKK